MNRYAREYGQRIKFLVEDGSLSKANKELKKCLLALGFGSIVELMDSLGYKISLKKKNPTNKYELIITNHAKLRTNNHLIGMCKKEADEDRLVKLIRTGQIIEYSDLLALGYRSKKENAENSTYIKMSYGMIAVLETNEENKLIWVTTLSSLKNPKSRVPITEKEYLEWAKKCDKIAKRRRP